MKILQINSVCGFGSTGRIANDLHGAYEEAGYESYIAFGRKKSLNCDEETTIKIGTKFDNYSHVLKTRVLDQHGFGSKNATTEFIEKVKKIEPDVIHLHNLHGYYVNVEVLFSYLKSVNKPVIWTFHDCWPFTGHCVHFEHVGCECWKPYGQHYCIQKNSYPSSWFMNNSKSNYARKKTAFTGVNNMTIITPSNWLANLVKKSFLKDYPVKVINNGVDIETFKPRPNDFKEKNEIDNQFMILGVASVWKESKGLKYFWELSEMIQSNEVIVLVGLSEKQLKSLPENIIGIPRTNSIQELAEIYSAADVFVNPTLEDTYPTTNLESLASGTPVITFDTGGSPEVIDEQTGIVTKEKTAESILVAIRELAESEISGSMCRKKALKYNQAEMVKEYIGEIQSLPKVT